MPETIRVEVDTDRGRVILHFGEGCELSFPPEHMEGLIRGLEWAQVRELPSYYRHLYVGRREVAPLLQEILKARSALTSKGSSGRTS